MTIPNAQTPNRQEIFRQKLADVLQDLQQTAPEDGEAVAMIGSLAAQLADTLGKPSWTLAKQAMSQANYDELLKSFDAQGNALLAKGETKKAYAIQAIATSLVAITQRSDAAIAEGERLLDGLIQHAEVLYRQHRAH